MSYLTKLAIQSDIISKTPNLTKQIPIPTSVNPRNINPKTFITTSPSYIY